MHINAYMPYTNPGTARFFGMRGLADTPAMGPYDATNPLPSVQNADGGSIFTAIGQALPSIAQGYSQIVTAQQTNQGLSTVSNVAIWGIIAFAAVKVLGNKRRK